MNNNNTLSHIKVYFDCLATFAITVIIANSSSSSNLTKFSYN